MKTNRTVPGILASIASLTLAFGCGGSSSNEASTSASTTTQVTSLAISLDGVAAIGTTTGGSGLRLADSESSVVGLDTDGKVLAKKMLAIDSDRFQLYGMLVAGDGSILIDSGLPTIFDPNTSITTSYDAKIPSGKMLMADCGGLLRVKAGVADCLILNDQWDEDGHEHFLSDRKKDLKFDKLGNIFFDNYRVSADGVATKLKFDDGTILTLMALLDDGTRVIDYNVNNNESVFLRLHHLDGSAKTIEGNFVWAAGNYVATSSGFYASAGEATTISGWAWLSNPVASTANGNALIVVGKSGEVHAIDTSAKTLTKSQLSASQILSATFTGSNFYYAATSGVSRVEPGLSLTTTAMMETKVSGLDDVSIFAMTKVGDRVLFSGQSDSDAGYVTGAITDTTATANDAEVKVTTIQSL